VVAARLARFDDERAPVAVVGEDACVEVAQRAFHRPRQGGEVEQVGRAEAARVGQGVGEHEASFGVRVDHLDRLAVHRCEDVAGAEGAAADGILGGADDADHAERDLELGERAEGRDHRAASGHVGLHVLHVVRVLDRHAARVERDRLPDEPEDDVGCRLRVLVAQDDEPRGIVAPLGDTGEGAHLELPDLVKA
jgi:hypothetical protein